MTHKTKKQPNPVPAVQTSIPEGIFKKIAIEDIDPSPFNYRKAFPEKKMAELADSIVLHGLIENLTLRLMHAGRYELVSGERRLRAAKIAGLTEVPAIIKDLTDDQVREIQLTENLQREDPHPLEEAEAIAQLQTRYKTIDEVAARVGKSRAFIYGRLRLLDLIPDLREMFIAETFTLKQVLEIAALSAASQQEFFKDYCEDWKDEDFEVPEIPYTLRHFTNDLNRAPFDIRDEALLPDRGACGKCPYNTATIATLFPEDAKEAICQDSACYQKKCIAHFTRRFTQALAEYQPMALIFSGSPSASAQAVIKAIPAAATLPQYNYYKLHTTCEPSPPDQDDYDEEDDPDGEGYKEAMEEYQSDLADFKHLWQTSDHNKGLLLNGDRIEPCLFTEMGQHAGLSVTPVGTAVTAAAVKTAIQAGNATPELLRSEIARINTRETRAQELDKEKLQLKIHELFSAYIDVPVRTHRMTTADQAAARFLLFDSLDYPTREIVLSRFRTDMESADSGGPAIPEAGADQAERLWNTLAGLSDEQHAYLTRIALSNRSDAKFPSSTSALFLTRMAQDAGLDIASIRQEQQAKIDSRQKSQTERIQSLEKKIAELETV